MRVKVIVTGGAGFIGSHLTEELLRQHADVHIIDNLATGLAGNVPPQAVFHRLDIVTQDAADVIVREKPDVVFHLAAQAEVQRSMTEPKFDADVNVSGTVNLLHAAVQAGVKKFVFASSSALYGDYQAERIPEDAPIHPVSYYGLSKWAGEAYIRLFHELHGLPFTILRYSNVYGPRQTVKGEGCVVALFLRNLRTGSAFRIHGDGEQTRDFVYVKDVVQANLAAAVSGGGQICNIGTSDSISINRLVDEMEKLHGTAIERTHSPARPGDIRYSCLDNSRAAGHLGWKPRYSVLEGLRESYDYYFAGTGQ